MLSSENMFTNILSISTATKALSPFYGGGSLGSKRYKYLPQDIRGDCLSQDSNRSPLTTKSLHHSTPLDPNQDEEIDFQLLVRENLPFCAFPIFSFYSGWNNPHKGQ